MTDSERIDPERIAALLDGRLSDAEAAAVRRQLATADEDTLAAFADAAFITAELEGGAAAAPAVAAAATVVPIESARSVRARRRWIVPSAAAAAAAAAIVSIIVWRPVRDPYPPGAFASALPQTVSTAEGPAWSATRGGGDNLLPRVRSARIGATLVDLEVDARRGQSTRASAVMLANLLDGTTRGSSVAASIRSLPEDSITKLSTSQIETIGRQSLGVVDAREFADAGAYLEAARLASAAGDTAFFTSSAQSALERLESAAPPIDAPTREALAAFTARIQERPRNAPAINTAAVQLLRVIAQ